MASDSIIRTYQQKCFRNYSSSVELPDPYTYPEGNYIRPLPPIKTVIGGLMIVGAYPSARFEKRPSQFESGIFRLIPVADNLQPFGYEQYFDGVQVRTLPSADGLLEYLLDPLEIAVDECWITDLVKVFLYKKDHVDSCGAAMPDFEVPMLRNQFRTLGQKSLPWLIEECKICSPKLIVTLGLEVAQVVSRKKSGTSKQLLRLEPTEYADLGNYQVLHLPHPDACRRYEKWRDHMIDCIASIKDCLDI